MSVLDAAGNQVSTRTLTDQQILAGFQQLSNRVENMIQQVTHIGFFTEFLYENVAAAVDAEDNPLVVIDMEEFGPWAQKRHAEIQEEIEQMVAQQNAATVNLDEGATQ